jgi:hypothetical protein
MAVDLADAEFIDSLKREVTPLGSVAADVDDSVWLGYLTDAFWLARLDGFMPGYTESGGDITGPNGEDLPREYVALIVLYAGIKALTIQILNTAPGFRAKAGPVEYEQDSISATVLAEMLKQLKATKDRIIAEILGVGATPTLYLDALSVRTFESASYWARLN